MQKRWILNMCSICILQYIYTYYIYIYKYIHIYIYIIDNGFLKSMINRTLYSVPCHDACVTTHTPGSLRNPHLSRSSRFNPVDFLGGL